MPFLVLLFIVVPIVELYVLIQVGQVIGALPTIGLLVLMSVLGAWLVRREGVRAWSRFRRTLGSGRLPTAEVVDGALLMLGGALLLTPGFLSDIVGLLLALPPTRAVVNRIVRSRTRGFIGIVPAPRRSGDGHGAGGAIDVEVVDVRRTAVEDHRD